MFNFIDETGHESGIIIYTKEDGQPEVIVAAGYGSACAENALPALAPAGGLTIWWPEPKDAELVFDREVEDIRKEIPGSVWAIEGEDDKIDTDLDIVLDEFNDIPAIFGFKAGDADPDLYNEYGYSGAVYHLTSRDDVKIVVPDFWN